MKNFIQPGDNLTVPAPSTTASGQGVQIGALFGVANGDAAEGAPLVLTTTGVFTLPKPAADEMTTGTPVFWDGEAATIDGTDRTAIGYAVKPATAGVATVAVRLTA